jgi:hemoglobin
MFKNIVQNLAKIFPKKLKEEDITPYLLIGEERGIRKLVDRFYFYMDSLEEARNCRDLHTGNLEPIKEKLYMFLSGWLGGPSLFVEKYGHPKMRRRHFPFEIGIKEKNEWLLCMRKAMDDLKLNSEFDQYLWESFTSFSEHMRNQE